MKKTIFTLICLLISSLCFAQKENVQNKDLESLLKQTQDFPESYEAWLELGLKYHRMCILEKKEEADNAVNALQKAYELKQNAQALVWLGSAWTLKGNEAKNPINKIDHVLKGSALMDDAVKIAEEDVVVRRIRAETFGALPVIFEKQQNVQDDLIYLMKQYSKTPEVFENKYDPAWAFYYYGKILIKNGNMKKGKKYLMLARKIVKDKDIEEQIKILLGDNK